MFPAPILETTVSREPARSRENIHQITSLPLLRTRQCWASHHTDPQPLGDLAAPLHHVAPLSLTSSPLLPSLHPAALASLPFLKLRRHWQGTGYSMCLECSSPDSSWLPLHLPQALTPMSVFPWLSLYKILTPNILHLLPLPDFSLLSIYFHHSRPLPICLIFSLSPVRGWGHSSVWLPLHPQHPGRGGHRVGRQ